MRRTLMSLIILSLAVCTGCQAEREPDHDRQNINQNATVDQNDNSGAENGDDSGSVANDNGAAGTNDNRSDQNDNGTTDRAGGTQPEKGIAATR